MELRVMRRRAGSSMIEQVDIPPYIEITSGDGAKGLRNGQGVLANEVKNSMFCITITRANREPYFTTTIKQTRSHIHVHAVFLPVPADFRHPTSL